MLRCWVYGSTPPRVPPILSPIVPTLRRDGQRDAGRSGDRRRLAWESQTKRTARRGLSRTSGRDPRPSNTGHRLTWRRFPGSRSGVAASLRSGSADKPALRTLYERVHLRCKRPRSLLSQQGSRLTPSSRSAPYPSGFDPSGVRCVRCHATTDAVLFAKEFAKRRFVDVLGLLALELAAMHRLTPQRTDADALLQQFPCRFF